VNDRPAVWPVLVTFVVLFVALQIGGGLVLAAWAFLSLPEGASPAAIPTQMQALLLTPLGLSVAVFLTSAPLAFTAFVGARVSGEPLGLRLRTRTAGVRWGLVPLMVLGMLAVSNALDSLIALAGLGDRGTLQLMGEVMASARGRDLALLTLVVALGAGVAEELFFRGFVQSRLSRVWPAWAAVAVASLCFGFMHFDPVHTPAAALLGLYLGWVAERAGSIVPAMIAHVVNNSVAVAGARWPTPQTTEVLVPVLAGSLLIGAALVLAIEWAYRRSPSAVPSR
jgi:membrane protease YdiL (CAAX protease family)